jgi:hypothetical protein
MCPNLDRGQAVDELPLRREQERIRKNRFLI